MRISSRAILIRANCYRQCASCWGIRHEWKYDDHPQRIAAVGMIRVLVVEDSLSQRHRLVSLIRESAGEEAGGEARGEGLAHDMRGKLQAEIVTNALMRASRNRGEHAQRILGE